MLIQFLHGQHYVSESAAGQWVLPPMSAALLARVKRLEQAEGNRCPVCAKPVLLRGAEQTVEPCLACGR